MTIGPGSCRILPKLAGYPGVIDRGKRIVYARSDPVLDFIEGEVRPVAITR